MLWGKYVEEYRPQGSTGCVYDWSAIFFGMAADGIKRVRKLGGQMKLEFVQGDGYAIMDKIRLDTLPRATGFPVLFDRIHRCNVPDYM